jgi:hypothetical protein
LFIHAYLSIYINKILTYIYPPFYLISIYLYTKVFVTMLIFNCVNASIDIRYLILSIPPLIVFFKKILYLFHIWKVKIMFKQGSSKMSVTLDVDTSVLTLASHAAHLVKIYYYSLCNLCNVWKV